MSRTLSTHDVAAPRRLAFWTDMVCRTYVQLECDAPAGTDVIDGEIVSDELATLQLSRVTSTAQFVRRTPELSEVLPALRLEAPAAGTPHLRQDPGGAREPALVRRSDRVHDDVVDLLAQSCQRLLQLRLVVDVRRQRVLDPRRERVDDRVLDRWEAVLEEERAEHGLEQGREHVAVG